MAEGGSVSAGSEDVIFDYFCEFCCDEGRNVEAGGYCIDCAEYLCDSCYTGHRATRFTRHHALQDKTNMPKGTPLSLDRTSKDISTKCEKHGGELVKYYCTSHCVLGCSTCIIEDHKQCEPIESVLKESETILDSHAFQSFMSKLDTLNAKSRMLAPFARDNKALSRRCCKDVVSSVRQMTEDGIKTLREFEKKTVALAEKIKSDDEQMTESVVDECTNVTATLGQHFSNFQRLRSTKRVCQLYISMRESEANVDALKQHINQLEQSATVRPFRFEPSIGTTSDHGWMDWPGALGEITHETRHLRGAVRGGYNRPRGRVRGMGVHQQVPMGVRQVPSKYHRNVMALNVWHILGKTVHDKNTCRITGSAAMDNKLVIADWNNSKLKLVDTNTNEIINTMDVSSAPWDVATISKQQAAVTLPNSMLILVINVTDTLKAEREITLQGACYGVAFSRNRFLVTFTDNPRVDILDMRGSVIMTIGNSNGADKLFVRPQYVCASNDGDTIYVSDYERDAVISIYPIRSGIKKVVYRLYTDEELSSPHKVCTDQKGNVYVCGRYSRNVHVMTSDLNKVKVILTQADGLDSGVWSVSHCQGTNKLFVGMKSNIVKAYKLS